jgi:ER lumen protein retaining receptor
MIRVYSYRVKIKIENRVVASRVRQSSDVGKLYEYTAQQTLIIALWRTAANAATMVWATVSFLVTLDVLSMIVSVVARVIYLSATYMINILAFFVLFWRLCATNDAKGTRFLETVAERSASKFCILTFAVFTGVSLRTQELFLLLYSTRFVGFLSLPSWHGWRVDMRALSCFVLFVNLFFCGLVCALLRFHEPTKFTYDPQHDSQRHCKVFVALCAVFALMNMRYYLGETLRIFSILVEVGAVVPQLLALRRCRPNTTNGVQSFVTLMFLYHVMTPGIEGDLWLLRTIPYVWFFCQFRKESNDASDDINEVQGQAITYDRKLWLASVRTELLSVYGDVKGCFLDLSSPMFQNDALQIRLAAVRREAEIIYGNVQRELGSTAVVQANGSEPEPDEETAVGSHARDSSEVFQLSKHDVETDEDSASVPLLHRQDNHN